MNYKRRLILILVIAGGLAADAKPVAAQSKEYKLKADWMYHFGSSLVDWGRNRPRNFVIGVLGGYSRDFEQQLQRIQRLTGAKGINGRPVRIRRFNSMADYERCDILFISKVAARGRTENARSRLDSALADRRVARGVLVISESDGFAGRGAMINFTVDPRRNRLTMQINPGEARRRGLTLQRRLTRSGAVTATVKTANTSSRKE